MRAVVGGVVWLLRWGAWVVGAVFVLWSFGIESSGKGF